MKKIAFTFLLILGLSFSVFGVDTSDQSPSSLQQSLMELGFRVFKSPVEAPEFALENLDGDEVTLSSFRGKLVLLNFWATWCPPCRAEMPSMQTLYEEIRDQGFEIVAVDLRESRKTVTDFIEENDFTFTVLLDATGSVGGIYGARSIPTSYLIDREGNAIGYLVGSRSWEGDEVRNVIFELLEA